MTPHAEVRPMMSEIMSIVRNDAQLYEGDLVHYFRLLFKYARDMSHPYHNLGHMLYVFWLCYQACLFYQKELTPREMRNLLIAALFHDFDHRGMSGDDRINIGKAVRAVRQHAEGRDKSHVGRIGELIRSTEYPYDVASFGQIDLCRDILCDADMCEVFRDSWVQQVVIGLAAESGKHPIDLARTQTAFLENLSFRTDWARQRFSQEVFAAKVKEVEELLFLLGDRSALSKLG